MRLIFCRRRTCSGTSPESRDVIRTACNMKVQYHDELMENIGTGNGGDSTGEHKYHKSGGGIRSIDLEKQSMEQREENKNT